MCYGVCLTTYLLLQVLGSFVNVCCGLDNQRIWVSFWEGVFLFTVTSKLAGDPSMAMPWHWSLTAFRYSWVRNGVMTTWEGTVVLVFSFHLLWLSLGILQVQQWVCHVCQIFICRTSYSFSENSWQYLKTAINGISLEHLFEFYIHLIKQTAN